MLTTFMLNEGYPEFLRSEDLIIPESMAQDFGFTDVLGKQAHSRLRNCFSSAAVESKDKSDSGIIEFSFLRSVTSVPEFQKVKYRTNGRYQS